MTRTTSSRFSTRHSRRYSPISTSVPSSTQQTHPKKTRRKALPPLCGPNASRLLGVLADSDPELMGLCKSEAQAMVNQYIQDAVANITGGAPKVHLKKVCGKGHFMKKLQPIVGHNDYMEIGRYYTMVSISHILITFFVTHNSTVH